MKIVVDAMGGDFAPKVNVDGAIDALREYPDMEIILVGPETLIEETISAYSNAEAMAKVRNRLTVVDAPEVITTGEHPVMALRRKKNSTFVVGMDIVRRKEAQAFVSAGSTGALMAPFTPETNSPADKRLFINAETAIWMRDHKVKCVGFGDGVSIENCEADVKPFHDIIMAYDGVFLEVLKNLEYLKSDTFFMSYSALPIIGADSCPVRAYAIEGLPGFSA